MERFYESMLILRPDLNGKEREEVFSRIIKKIESLEGKVNDSKIWAKERELYYPIRSRGAEKKKFNKGCYWLLRFYLDAEKLKELKETIRLEERILRNLIIRRDG
jgi:ribosomal protein S6